MIKKEYTKEGLRLTHPSGVVQVLSVEALTSLKNRQEQRRTRIDEDITRINAHILEVQKIVSHG